MILVLIHWRIKPDDASETAFFDFWTQIAKIDDKSNLIGEFLSTPVPAVQFPFNVDDLSTGHSQGNCRHFINVGAWKDWQSFNDQVGKYIDDAKSMKDFEAERRTRTVLEPKHWRIGSAMMPSGTCE